MRWNNDWKYLNRIIIDGLKYKFKIHSVCFINQIINFCLLKIKTMLPSTTCSSFDSLIFLVSSLQQELNFSTIIGTNSYSSLLFVFPLNIAELGNNLNF